MDHDLTDQIGSGHDLIVTAGLGSEGPGSLGAWGGGGTRRSAVPRRRVRRSKPKRREHGRDAWSTCVLRTGDWSSGRREHGRRRLCTETLAGEQVLRGLQGYGIPNLAQKGLGWPEGAYRGSERAGAAVQGGRRRRRAAGRGQRSRRWPLKGCAGPVDSRRRCARACEGTQGVRTAWASPAARNHGAD